jgi:hypothetical protein
MLSPPPAAALGRRWLRDQFALPPGKNALSYRVSPERFGWHENHNQPQPAPESAASSRKRGSIDGSFTSHFRPARVSDLRA